MINYLSYFLNVFFLFHIFMSPLIGSEWTVIKLSDHVSPDCRGSMHTLVSGQWQLRDLVLVDGCLYVYKHHDHPATSKCIYIEVPGLIFSSIQIIEVSELSEVGCPAKCREIISQKFHIIFHHVFLRISFVEKQAKIFAFSR